MTSLFDQYEQSAARSTGYIASQRSAAPKLTTAGFINARSEEETPMFSKERIRFRPTCDITNLVVNSNLLVLSMTNNVLLRIDLLQPDSPDEIDIMRNISDRNTSPKVHGLFQDPSGQHLVVSLSVGDNNPFDCFYISKNSKKLKMMSKAKGKLVTAVAWNYNAKVDGNSTGPILVGTSTGKIYETEFVCGDERYVFSSSAEQYWKKVYEIDSAIITGMHLHKYIGNDKYFVLVTTPSRLYQFVGSGGNTSETPILQHVFSSYSDVPDRFVDMPEPMSFSLLELNYGSSSSLPRTFGWLTGPGVLYGDINISGVGSMDSVTANTRLVQHPKDAECNQPVGLVLTEFHVLILFPYRLKVICILNEQLVFEDVFSESFGRMVGITKEPHKPTIWAFSEQAVYKYKVMKEDRNVWQIYLEKEDFQLAKRYCKDHPEHLDKVMSTEADKLFQSKRYEECAALYAKTRTSFERVALKFMEISETEALMTFLMKKLDGLKQHDQTQITMIVTWLIELYLNKLGMIKDAGQQQCATYKQIQEAFHKFLGETKIKECVGNNKGAVYDLMSSHGNQEDLIFFAIQMKDFEKVIRYHVQHGNSQAALYVLTKQNNVDLFYQFSPSLIQSIPKQTIDAWKALGRKLNPSLLIPALVQYSSPTGPDQVNHAIEYLEFCVNVLDNKEQAIHNYLLSLYTRHQPDKLMAYLNLQGQDSYNICYDLKYALRLCSELNQHQACVHIYATMGLYEEAVDLALKVDVGLAKQNANRPDDDEELKKKLWLKIAKHVVKEENDIEKAMEFLHECDLVKIEDILPFFKDFVTIDHFKDAICASLHEYNEHIEDLKKEMDEATKKAQEIRGEIQSFRNKYAFVQGQDKCSVCSYPIMSRSFYLFPCRHLFHTDCLIAEVIPQMTSAKRARVEEIHRQLHNVSAAKEDNVSIGTSMPSISSKDQLNNELDDLVASECLYCGEMIIKNIDQPFIDAEEYDSVMRGWD